MKIHEYQAKGILKKYGVTVPRGTMATSREEAEAAAKELFSAGATGVVVKAQIHAGGRGKGGGVKIAKSVDEAGELAGKMLGMKLVTHQTGPEGRIVRRLLIEETLPIEKELVSGHSGRPRRRQARVHGVGRGRNGNRASRGGKSGAILKQHIDPGMGLEGFRRARWLSSLG
jgi:succinyl-CoA synthetase beta subunit